MTRDYSPSDQSGVPSSSTSSCGIEMKSVGAQVRHWQNYSTEELDNELYFRISTRHYPFTCAKDVRLKSNYHMKEICKQIGAMYDGQVKRWYIPAGYDLRVYVEHPEWLDF